MAASEADNLTVSSSTPFRVLVFSKTTPDSYRHESIPAGIAAFEGLAASSQSTSHPFTATASEDSAIFTPESLSSFRVIVLLNVAGNFLSASQLDALRRFVGDGGGIVGVHAATTGMPTRAADKDTVDKEGWYGRLLGAEFSQHPQPQWGTAALLQPGHAITRQAAQLLRARNSSSHADSASAAVTWNWFDEWYNFKKDPRSVLGDERVNVLISVDEKSYEGGTMGSGHPIAWCHQEEGGGGVFYTALGHFDEAYQDEVFMAHIRDGLLWAAGVLK